MPVKYKCIFLENGDLITGQKNCDPFICLAPVLVEQVTYVDDLSPEGVPVREVSQEVSQSVEAPSQKA